MHNIYFFFIWQFATMDALGGTMQIGELEKGKDKIIISLKEFKGKQYIDIRTYFENQEGEWIPTKKGISLTPENLDDVIKFLKDAKQKVSGK